MPHEQSQKEIAEGHQLGEGGRMETLRESRKLERTRFVADENLEPWALFVMRYKKFDIMNADQAGLRGRADTHVFGRAWQLRRVLVTHDADFLNDAAFPLRSCAGLIVLPQYGSVSLEFGNLLSAAASLVSRGESLWFHTKIEATRQFVLKVRTLDKSEGRITKWTFTIPRRDHLRGQSRCF